MVSLKSATPFVRAKSEDVFFAVAYTIIYIDVLLMKIIETSDA